jgi:hypothetical protein
MAAAVRTLGFAAALGPGGGEPPDVKWSMPLPTLMSLEGSISILMGGGRGGGRFIRPVRSAAKQRRAIWKRKENPAGFT